MVLIQNVAGAGEFFPASLSLSLSRSLSLSLVLSRSVFLSLSVCLCLSLSLCVSLSASLSLHLCLRLHPRLSVSLSACLAVFPPPPADLDTRILTRDLTSFWLRTAVLVQLPGAFVLLVPRVPRVLMAAAWPLTTAADHARCSWLVVAVAGAVDAGGPDGLVRSRARQRQGRVKTSPLPAV